MTGESKYTYRLEIRKHRTEIYIECIKPGGSQVYLLDGTLAEEANLIGRAVKAIMLDMGKWERNAVRATEAEACCYESR